MLSTINPNSLSLLLPQSCLSTPLLSLNCSISLPILAEHTPSLPLLCAPSFSYSFSMWRTWQLGSTSDGGAPPIIIHSPFVLIIIPDGGSCIILLRSDGSDPILLPDGTSHRILLLGGGSRRILFPDGGSCPILPIGAPRDRI